MSVVPGVYRYVTIFVRSLLFQDTSSHPTTIQVEFRFQELRLDHKVLRVHMHASQVHVLNSTTSTVLCLIHMPPIHKFTTCFYIVHVHVICTWLYAHTQPTYSHTHVRTHTHTHTRARTHTYIIHIHTHTRTHIYTDTHTHTHTHYKRMQNPVVVQIRLHVLHTTAQTLQALHINTGLKNRYQT